jgi:glycosyltransferase involved in cell wall biosynthesis
MPDAAPPRRKVLHVTQSTGGVETSLLSLFSHFDALRYELHLACPPGTALAKSAKALGVSVFEIGLVRIPHPIRDLLALFRLARLIKREGYLIVHTHSAKGGYLGRLAARLAGSSKTIYAPQAFSYLSQTGLARPFFRLLERAAVPLTDVLVASSPSESRRAIADVGYSSSRVSLIPNSVDLDESRGLNVASAAVPPIVLTVGRLSYQKNPEMFVRVARLVLDRRPGVRFVINGGAFASPLETRIRRIITRYGLDGRIEIVPWTARGATLELIRKCSVFVLTSRFEGMPYALLEAMMLRRPVVVTNVDGSRDAVQSGSNGYVVTCNDVQAMADCIIGLLDDRKLANSMGERGYELVREHYDIRKNVKCFERLYDQLLQSSGFEIVSA